jgi:MerR family transcriptional regulator, thiopeptide resistance regulator
MYTIHELCGISGLSRSTILYYDGLGLLKPAQRSTSNYRLYSEDSVTLLEKICLYREAGVSLADIGQLVGTPDNGDLNLDILERTLYQLNQQAQKVKNKQRVIIDMIKSIKDTKIDDDAECEKYYARQARRIALFAFDIRDASSHE